MSKKSFIAQERRNMKVKAKSFEAWKVIMITLVFLSYCVGMMPGEKAQAVYDKYLDNGIFGMAFFFVLVNNLMGLIPIFPGGANITGNIAITMVLALCTFIMINVFGSKEYWKDIFWPNVPVWLKCPIPMMPVIELFGIFTKPFALMIRLFANIMAGHAAILSLVAIIFITVKSGALINGPMTVVSVLFGIFMDGLEVLVAFIQAYVFTMLSAVFIGLSREGGHEEKE